MSPVNLWHRRNLRLLEVFAPVLVATGVLGFVVPARASLMSGAPPYNVFHIVAGCVGLVLVLARKRRAAAGFNFVFGLIDLYQALAGMVGVFPAELFALRPADHVVHVVVGAFLVVCGWLGLRMSRAYEGQPSSIVPP